MKPTLAIILILSVCLSALAQDKAKPVPLSEQEQQQIASLAQIEQQRQADLQAAYNEAIAAPLDAEHAIAAVGKLQLAASRLNEVHQAKANAVSRLCGKHQVDPDRYALSEDGKELTPLPAKKESQVSP